MRDKPRQSLSVKPFGGLRGYFRHRLFAISSLGRLDRYFLRPALPLNMNYLLAINIHSIINPIHCLGSWARFLCLMAEVFEGLMAEVFEGFPRDSVAMLDYQLPVASPRISFIFRQERSTSFGGHLSQFAIIIPWNLAS